MSDLPQVLIEEIPQDCICSEVCFTVSDSGTVLFPVEAKYPVQQDAKDFWAKRPQTAVYRSIHTGKHGTHKTYKKHTGYKGNKRGGPRRHHRNPTKMPSSSTKLISQPSTSEATSFAQQPSHRTETCNGLAILDTGASRSVIGSDNIPAVLQKLPMSVRDLIKEKPSRIGFRFGNNHIAYSFKQLQIPLIKGKTRFWLLVEVVPKATPFLLSIKAMKSLGANLGLPNNTCYLKTLQRSLPLRENKNGLFAIDMSDLCQDQSANRPSEAAFTTSSQIVSAPPGLDCRDSSQDADPPGSSGSAEDFGRRSSRSLEDPLHDLVPTDNGESTRDEHDRRSDASHQSLDPRGHKSEGEDSRAQQHHPGPIHNEPNTTQCLPTKVTPPLKWWPKVRRMGTGRDGSRDVQPCCTGPKFFPSIFYSDDQGSSPTHATSRKSINDHSASSSSASSSTTRWKPSGFDTNCIGHLGSKANHLRQEKQGQKLCRDLRERPIVQSVGPGPSWKPVRKSSGLCQLRDHSQAPRTSGHAKFGLIGEWQKIPNQTRFANRPSMRHLIKDPDEAMWLKDVCKLVNKGNYHCKQLDLLEIYASKSSQLTTVAQNSGLHAERFTYEDGDLNNPEGQAKLLSIMVLKRPKHIWLAPECGTWCAWNRFNANRSWSGFATVFQKQQDQRIHRKFCTFLCKLQVSEDRHAHMENPWTSEAWHQQELEPFLAVSLPAKLDQCMLGLIHPDTQLSMKKHTRVQTTSRAMFMALDHRICRSEHQHTPIAGTCHVNGVTMNTSAYASQSVSSKTSQSHCDRHTEDTRETGYLSHHAH